MEVSKTHKCFFNDSLCKSTSPYLCERLIYIGQLDSYESGASIASMLLGVETNDTAIYRLSDRAGEVCEELLEESGPDFEPEEDEHIYAQMDGSMILTREEGWKEVKLGRVFPAKALCPLHQGRNWVRSSQYVAHLGDHQSFEHQFSRVIDPYEHLQQRLVFICDGAKWQWNWIKAAYPHATQILDFYHAIEHVGEYLTLFEKGTQLTDHMQQLTIQLKTQGPEKLIEQLDKDYLPKTKRQQQEQHRLRRYFQQNQSRMHYPAYIQQGLLIGSGAIESAHRTVIQRRMKLAGQRWSIQGAQRMLKLRTLNMSGQWERLKNRIQKAA